MLPNPMFWGIEIGWYALFQYTSVVFVLVVGAWLYAAKWTEKWDAMDSCVLFWIAGFLALSGSRIIGYLEHYLAFGNYLPIQALWQLPHHGHFSWCGALLFLILFLPPVAKKILGAVNYWSYLDFVAINLCLLPVVAKQGCLFAGDGCYGIPTTLPWGMHFAYGAAPSLLPVHPTPIYDGIFNALLFICLLQANSIKKYSGQIAMGYFGLSSCYYMVMEFLRINPKVWTIFTLPQLTYFVVLAITLYRHRAIYYSRNC